MNTLFNINVALFLFTTFNREFSIFGFDPRYLSVATSIIFIIARLLEKWSNQYSNHLVRRGSKADVVEPRHFSQWDIFLFYVVVLISNVSWLWNGLTPNDDILWNLVILNGSNALFAISFILGFRYLSEKFVVRCVTISLCVLYASMLWVYAGMEIPSILSSENVKVASIGEGYTNLFGVNIRSAGFAEDANIASLFAVTGIFVGFDLMPKGAKRNVFIALSMLCYALAFSKTILIGFAVVVLVCLVRAVVSKSWKVIAWCVVIGVACCAFFVIPSMEFSDYSMALRLTMWDCAERVFIDNPIFGGGISSVRAGMDAMYGNWYVQCHSTWWQIIGEHGIFAVIVFIVMSARRLTACSNWPEVMIYVQLLMLSVNYETIFQQFFIMFYVLFPLVLFNCSKNKLKDQSERCSKCV